MFTQQTLRTFVALPLSEDMHAQLAQVQTRLRRSCPAGSVRWVKPERIHLTIFFLGDVLPALLEPAREALGVVARHVSPFTFRVEGLGVFPNPRRPRVIWVGITDSNGRLALLHQAVNEALSQAGFRPEERAFNPHLTLGRVKRRAVLEEARAVGSAVLRAEVGGLGEASGTEMILFRSVLKSTGAEYTPLATFRLGGEAHHLDDLGT